MSHGPKRSPTAAPVRVVLLRPRNPENLGAVARAMKNFGLADWAIAELGTHDFATARRVAVHAEDLLEIGRGLVRTLDEAVADCAVVGTELAEGPGSGALRRRARARGARPRAGGADGHRLRRRARRAQRTTRSTAATTSPSSRRTTRSRR